MGGIGHETFVLREGRTSRNPLIGLDKRLCPI
jgi:hypothetical protein